MAACALPLAPAAAAMVPADPEQVASIDYVTLSHSGSLAQLQTYLVPRKAKDFQNSLAGLGISKSMVKQFVFLALRNSADSYQIAGIAQGTFSLTGVVNSLNARNLLPAAYHSYALYSVNGLDFTFVDATTFVFGDHDGIRMVLDTRDGTQPNISSNAELSGLIAQVSARPAWSVFNQRGTQRVLNTAFRGASNIVNIAAASRDSALSLTAGSTTVTADYDLNTTDATTATAMAALFQSYVQLVLLDASPSETIALQALSAVTNGAQVRIHYGDSAVHFRSVLQTRLLAAVTDSTLLGDVNGDGTVNCSDVALVKTSFGKRAGLPGYIRLADVNDDGIVDVNDLRIVTAQLAPRTECK